MKKYIFVLLAILLCIILYGCSSAHVQSEMNIYTKSGAGTRTIFVNIEKDHKLSHDDRRSGNTNSVFFPKGFEPVRDYIQSIVPDWCVIELEEKPDHWVYTLSYSFKDIDDYNKKTRQLIDDIIYEEEELEPATLTAVEKDGGWDLTFKEQTATTHSIVLGYVTELHFQDEIFDRARNGIGVVVPRDNFEVKLISVKIGNHSRQSTGPGREFIEVTRFLSSEEDQNFWVENPDFGATPTVGENESDNDPSNNQNNNQDDDKKSEGRKESQVVIVVVISVSLIAALLLAALIGKRLLGKNKSNDLEF